MPVGPNYDYKTNIVNVKQVHKIVHRIDSWITKDYNANKHRLEIIFTIFGKVNHATLLEVRNIYKEAGWLNVSIDSDYYWYLPDISVSMHR